MRWFCTDFSISHILLSVSHLIKRFHLTFFGHYDICRNCLLNANILQLFALVTNIVENFLMSIVLPSVTNLKRRLFALLVNSYNSCLKGISFMKRCLNRECIQMNVSNVPFSEFSQNCLNHLKFLQWSRSLNPRERLQSRKQKD